MSKELAVRQLHSHGASADDICLELGLPIALVDEILQGDPQDNPFTPIELPILEDLVALPRSEIDENINKYANYLAHQSIINLNRPDNLNAIGKASVILNNVVSALDKLKTGDKGDNENKFARYLKD